MGQTPSTKPLSFTVITDQNDAPTDINLSANAVDENIASGTVVGGLSTTDADNGNTFTYTLLSGGSDNANFSISGANLVTAAVLDFETQSSYSVVIQTSDGSATYSKNIYHCCKTMQMTHLLISAYLLTLLMKTLLQELLLGD